MLGNVGMGERAMPAKRCQNERAVLLTHKLRARFCQHLLIPFALSGGNTCSSQSICHAVIQGFTPWLTAWKTSDIYFLDCREKSPGMIGRGIEAVLS